MARDVIRIKVEGVPKVIATLHKFDIKKADLKGTWERIGGKISREAKTIVPVLTGRLQRSIRPSKKKNRATIRAGRNTFRYAPVIHYGGYNNIQGFPFLVIALHQNRQYIETEVSNDIDMLIRRLGLR